jgi:hypothetical protein
MSTSSLLRAAVCAAIVIATGTLMSEPAAARDRSARIQGPRTGATVQRQSMRSPEQATIRRSFQGDLGRGATTVRNTTADAGAASSSSTTTFNNGRAIRRQGSLVNNGDGSATYEATRNGARGTASAAGTLSRTDDGVTRSGTLTGARGNTFATSGELVRTDTGVSRTRSLSNAQGESVTRETDYSYERGEGLSRSSTTTGPNGASISSMRVVWCVTRATPTRGGNRYRAPRPPR